MSKKSDNTMAKKENRLKENNSQQKNTQKT